MPDRTTNIFALGGDTDQSSGVAADSVQLETSLDTHHKALSINLDGSVFGSFAEIGAGQEVARWFFKVGGASATVAKTISAYDKEVSDQIYGPGTRYVSVDRLRAMLDKEWNQLLSQVRKERGASTRLFSFVDTVSARNYAGTNSAHGWMGVRFQHTPGAPSSDIILHFNLLDSSNLRQQEAIGILGVNLLYEVHRERMNPETFLTGIGQFVAPVRLQIDFIEVKGPMFDHGHSDAWSCLSMHTRLVTSRQSEAVIWIKDVGFMPFIEALHKKPVVLAPGIFDHPSSDHAAMLATALKKFGQEQKQDITAPLGLFCLTVSPSETDASERDRQEILQKVEALHALGYGVLLIQAREIYRMSAIVQQFTSLPIRFVVGISALLRVFGDDYSHLAGSILKAISILFSQDVRIYAFPMATPSLQDAITKLKLSGWSWTDSEGIVIADSVRPPGALQFLYEYLISTGFIVPIQRAEILAPFGAGS